MVIVIIIGPRTDIGRLYGLGIKEEGESGEEDQHDDC